MAPISTNAFTTDYAKNDKVVASNFTEGPINCFNNIPFVENPIGVTIPNNTGIHAGIFLFSSKVKFYVDSAGCILMRSS